MFSYLRSSLQVILRGFLPSWSRRQWVPLWAKKSMIWLKKRSSSSVLLKVDFFTDTDSAASDCCQCHCRGCDTISSEKAKLPIRHEFDKMESAAKKCSSSMTTLSQVQQHQSRSISSSSGLYKASLAAIMCLMIIPSATEAAVPGIVVSGKSLTMKFFPADIRPADKKGRRTGAWWKIWLSLLLRRRMLLGLKAGAVFALQNFLTSSRIEAQPVDLTWQQICNQMNFVG